MPSDLGKRIRSARTAQGIGLRELGRLIQKSPGFLTQLECEDEVPSVAEETLQAIAKELELNADELIVLARRTPSDVIPESVLDVEMFRKVKAMSDREKQEFLRRHPRKS